MGKFLQKCKSSKISNGVWNWTVETATNQDSGKQDQTFGSKRENPGSFPQIDRKVAYKFVNFVNFPISVVSDPVKPLL